MMGNHAREYRLLFLVLFGLFIGFFSLDSHADPCVWNTDFVGNTDWDDAGAWDNCATGFPTGAISAVKARGANVILRSDVTIEGFDYSAGTVSMNDEGTPRTLTMNGLFVWGDRSFTGNAGGLGVNGGTIITQGPSTLATTGQHLLSADILWINRGVVDFSGGRINLQGGGSGLSSFQNDPAGTLNFNGDVDLFDGVSSNAGLFDKIGGTGDALITTDLTNTGTIRSSSGNLIVQIPNTFSMPNTGTLIAAAGANDGDNILTISNNILNNAGGIIEAETNSWVNIDSADIVGGTIRGAGTIRSVSTSSYDGVTIDAGTNFSIVSNLTRLLGDITNHGTMTLLGNGQPQADLRISGDSDFNTTADDVKLLGNGELVLDGDGDTPRVLADTLEERLIQGPNHTMRGTGQFGAANRLEFENQGLVRADGGQLSFNPPGDALDANARAFNSGTMAAVNGGTLLLQLGHWDNSLGLMVAEAGSTLRIESTRIQGGTLSSQGDGVIELPSLIGIVTSRFDSIAVSSGSRFEMAGSSDRATFTGTTLNNGEIEVSGSLSIRALGDGDLGTSADDVTFSGSGEVILVDVNSQIIGDGANERFVNGEDHTISGGGRLGGNGLTILNHGRIENIPAIEGEFTQSSTGVLQLDVRADDDFDQVNLTQGDAQLGGTLELYFEPDYAPIAGTSYDVLSVGASQVINLDGLQVSAVGLDPGAQFGLDIVDDVTLRVTVLNNTTTSAPSLVASLLPTNRSVLAGTGIATAFVSIINLGSQIAEGCAIAPATLVDAGFSFQTTDAGSNAVTGTPDTPVDIPGNSTQTFVVVFTPNSSFAPTDVSFDFTCTNSQPAPVFPNLNTLTLSATAAPVADVIALAATPSMDGIANVDPGSMLGLFTVASLNVGASDGIMVSAEPSSGSLGLTVTICQTDPATSVCINPLTATTDPVSLTINNGETPTFGVFLVQSGEIPFDALNNRVFVRFTDSGGVVRGGTSVAVRTQ